MKKLVYFLLFLLSTVAFSQSNTITYQAVIYLPSGQNAPGVNVNNVPMTNKNICLQFSFIDANNRVEYQEEIKVKTDEFGMVNITIGNGDQSGGYASSFDAIVWNASVQKNLQVALDALGLCNQFEILSNEPIASVPFANAAITAGNVSGVVALANGGTGATTAVAARSNLGIGNVDNTSDLNKPLSTATKTYVDTAIAGATIVDADTTTKGKIQLAGDLAGTAAAPTVPGLTLKENAANKSTTATLGTSDVLFPTQNAVKTYVDTAITGATIADADTANKGKIQLAGDLAGTAAAPTVPGLALKENAANKSTTTTLGTSDVLFPTQNAVKTYVDTAIAGATIVDADATTKGKIQLAGDLAGTAAAPTVPGLALKENAENKSTTTTLGTSDVLFPTQKAVKTYVDTAIAGATIVDADTATKGKIQLAGDLAGTAAAPTVPGLALKENAANKSTTTTLGTSDVLFPTQKAVKTYVDTAIAGATIADADTATKGKIKLAGDLAGTAASPEVAVGAISTVKLATDAVETIKIKNGNVTYDKIQNVSATDKVLGRVSTGAGVVEEIATTGTGDVVRATSPTLVTPIIGAATGTSLSVSGQFTSTIADGTAPFVVTSTTPVANLSIGGNAATVTTNANLTGDVTSSGNATTIGANKVVTGMIANANVTNAKLDKANIPLSGFGAAAADVALGANKLTGVADPTLAQDAATKNYVDTATAGITTLADGKIYLGNASNVATEVTPSGDVTMTNAGVTAIGTGKVVVGMLATDAVETIKIKDANVTAAKLAADAVETAKIKDGNVTYAKIQNVATGKVLGRVSVNAGVVEEIATTGSGNVVRATSPTLVTPTLGVATATSVNGLTPTALATGFTIEGGSTTSKTLTVSGDATVSGTTSGTNTGDQTITLTGDVTGSGTGSFAATIGTGKVTTATIAADAVTSAKIADATIVVGDLAADAVETAKIKDANVTYAKIQNVSASNKVLGRVSANAGVVEEIATTGSGDVVRATSPTLVTPVLGAATGTSLSVSGQLTSTVAIGTAPLVVTSTTPVANLSIGGNAATVTTNANLTGPITSVGNATTITDGAVTTAKILDGTIAVGDLADNAVETAKIKDTAVTNGKLDKTNIPLSGFGAATADVALGAKKLTGVADPTLAQDAATKNYVDTATAGITTLANGKIYLGNASNEATEVTPTGDVTITNAGVTAIGSEKVVAGMLATDAVETAKIKNLNVTTGKLADGAVTTVKLSTDAVETAKIKDAAVTTAKILDGTILVDDLADAAVETAKIKDLNVTTGKLAASAVTYAKIQNVSATNKVLGRVSANAGVVEEIATTGSGDVVRATSPTLVTPTLGVATATSVAFSGATSGTATIAAPATAGTTTITLPGASGTLATLAGTETLTNKTLTSPILTTPTLGVATATSVGYSGSTSGTATIVAPAIAGTTTITLPGATGTLATLAGAETLTNKTLTSPALTTPALGVATATSINKVTITTPSTGATLTIANGKTLTANNSIVLAGTDDKTMTFPTTDATIARTDAAQTFTGVQTFSSDIVVNSVNIGRGNGAITTNTAVGTDAISATATGADNAALGYNALKVVTSGARNAVVGSQAAKALLTGIDNIALGYRALATATSSESNTAIGSDALKVLGDSTNDRNTAVGTGSFSSLTTGQYNVAVGQGTFLNATSGSNNVGVGKYAGFRDINDAGVTSSNKSVFIGAETKPLNSTSTNEIVIGYDARGLGNNTTVLGNSLITQAKVFGALNLPDATTSTTATTGALTVAGGAGIAENLNVGGNAKITGTLTVASGAGAGKVLTSDANGLGTWTTPAGVTTMAAIGSTPNADGATISGVNLNLEPASATYGGVVTTGAQTFAGAKTFSPAVTAASSLGIGTNFTPTLTAAATGDILVGLDINPTFTNGSYTGLTNYGLRVQGIGFGRGGGAVVSNIAIGSGTLINNSSGANNTGLGYRALQLNSNGIDNTAIGYNAGDKITSGSKNIFVGSSAGSKIASSTTSNTTGANSVLIGYDVRPAADGETNEIVISGYNGTAGTVGKGSNTTSIGNAATTDTYIYGNLIVSGQVKLNSTSAVLVLSKTANYDIATTDNANLIIFKGSTASQTIKLPAASANIGREITIKNIATVSVSIASAGGYLISDSSTTTAATLAIGIEPSNNWIKAISDGTDWIILRALF